MNPRPAWGTGTHGDPWSLDLRCDPRLKGLYLDPEQYDGYLRDQDVFGPGITIYDNMSLVVDYHGGASMTYSLNAHNPWEGYTVAINCTQGRAKLTVVERGTVTIDPEGDVVLDASATPGAAAFNPSRPEGERLLVQRHWEPAREVPIPAGAGGHGDGDGDGDSILLMDVFRRDLRVAPDPDERATGCLDGIGTAAIGIAANNSLATGQPAVIADLDLGVNLIHAAS